MVITIHPPHHRHPLHRMSPSERSYITGLINTALLRCECLLVASEIPKMPRSTLKSTLRAAMYHANEALELASAAHMHQQVSRAYLFRGHVFRYTQKYRDAHWCYVRAASLPEFAMDHGPGGLTQLTTFCLQNIKSKKERQQTILEGIEADAFESSQSRAFYHLYDHTKNVKPKLRTIKQTCTNLNDLYTTNTANETRERKEEEQQRGHKGGVVWLRDGNGTIVGKLDRTPSLRSVKGKRFYFSRDNLFTGLLAQIKHSVCGQTQIQTQNG
ncbi:hypothetical protein QBC46DRAFT_421031 [Diplogelasinospora grovesii]|uniref:Uncharacterized protein n=1 Tax=Diplogelasinospora grovesii TaxID=303347 RepID=A0AAN6N047_9PEZI|nr:hypothetical protein QBC46DRAFT_421031 [Diplogelasinospora grovesii]